MHGVPPGFSRSQRGRAARAPARDPGMAGCRAGRRAPCRASLHVSRLRRGPRVHQPRRRRGRGRRPSPGAVDRMGAGHRDVVDARDPWVAPQRFRHGRQDRRADPRVTRRNRHASGGLPASTLERLRDRRFRREPRLRVRSDASALAFIHDVGFCSTFYRFPEGVACLWEAVVGRRNPRWPRRSHHDDGVGLTWQLKDTLPSRRDVYYGKLLKGRPLLVALDVFPAFYGVTRGRQRARDYRAEYDAGHLSLTARRLMDALVREHPQYTRGLRANTFMLDPGKTREFERAMAELQQGLWIVKTEERYEPTFSYRWDLLEAWLPDAVAEGRRLGRARAIERLIERFVAGAVFTNERVLARLFRLPGAEVTSVLERLVRRGTLAADAAALDGAGRVGSRPRAARPRAASRGRAPRWREPGAACCGGARPGCHRAPRRDRVARLPVTGPARRMGRLARHHDALQAAPGGVRHRRRHPAAAGLSRFTPRRGEDAVVSRRLQPGCPGGGHRGRHRRASSRGRRALWRREDRSAGQPRADPSRSAVAPSAVAGVAARPCPRAGGGAAGARAVRGRDRAGA